MNTVKSEAVSVKGEIKPTNNHILVKLDSTEVRTAAGLILPANEYKARTYSGVVQAIADNIENPGFQVGDRVIFQPGFQYDLKLDKSQDITHSLVLIYDVLAVVGKETNVEVK